MKYYMYYVHYRHGTQLPAHFTLLKVYLHGVYIHLHRYTRSKSYTCKLKLLKCSSIAINDVQCTYKYSDTADSQRTPEANPTHSACARTRMPRPSLPARRTPSASPTPPSPRGTARSSCTSPRASCAGSTAEPRAAQKTLLQGSKKWSSHQPT